MGEIWGTVHPEAKFFSSRESTIPDQLCVSKSQWRDRHSIGTLIPKGKNQKKGDAGSQTSPKLCKANGFHEILRVRNNPHWSYALPSTPTGQTVLCPQVGKGVLPFQFHGLLHTWFCGVALSLTLTEFSLNRSFICRKKLSMPERNKMQHIMWEFLKIGKLRKNCYIK